MINDRETHRPGRHNDRRCMFSINGIVFITGVLLLIGTASSKFASRLGMPVLVLFLAVGMLAGSEGIGGIAFENYGFANSLGSVALALILFDGGLRTSITAVKSAWRPALSLSTIGVLVTSVLTGLAAAWVLKIPLLHGMLLGSIVGSTDAAAVFSILRTSGLKLPEQLTATLEVESGSNDPMAIFLTVGLIGVITGTAGSTGELLALFVLQFGVGSIIGIGAGYAGAWLVNRSNLDHPGLYPILALSIGLLTFGLTALAGGSGFLAVYLAGIMFNHKLSVFRRGIFLFHDAGAWLSQIVLFVMLGLLSFPSRLLSVAFEGLLIALVLVFVARPLAVVMSTLPFRFNSRELTFLSWVGLKGAVPITLATFPLLAGVQGSELMFNVVFFVVLVSAITQGWSLALVARLLKIGQPLDSTTPLSVEINALRHVDGEIVEYVVATSSRVAGRTLNDLALPYGVVVTLVVRDKGVVIPRGFTVFQPGDHVFIAMRTRLKPLMDCLFDSCTQPPRLAPGFTLRFHGDSTLGQLQQFLGFPETLESSEPVRALVHAVDEGQPVRVGGFVADLDESSDQVLLIWDGNPEFGMSFPCACQ